MSGMDHSGWHACFTVGHELLDAQHRKLFRLCQELCRELSGDGGEPAIAAGGGAPPASAARLQDGLHELMVHVVRHFRTEESLLEECAYAALERHRQAHEDYLQRLSALIFDCRCGRLDHQEVGRYLKQWWIDHILECDKHYSPALSGW